MKLVRKRGPSPKTTPDEKTKPKKAVGDKPKRGKTGYLLYADEVRAEVRAELEAEVAEGEKLKPQDVVKAIAARWKAEDQDIKDEWNAKAKTPQTSDDEAAKEVPASPPKKEKKDKKEKAKPEPKKKAEPEPKKKAPEVQQVEELSSEDESSDED